MEIVNGYVCNNCTDVANAKRNIDPAHPKDGPFGQDAPDAQVRDKTNAHGQAVVFGGSLAHLDPGAIILRFIARFILLPLMAMDRNSLNFSTSASLNTGPSRASTRP